MSCSGRYANLLRGKSDPKRADKVFGTWDFKWPQGTEIKVAFQWPPDRPEFGKDTVKEVARRIEQLANAWLTTDDGKRAAPNISFKFAQNADQWFSAPAKGEDSSGSDVAGVASRDYDVLVSLAPLPTREPATEAGQPERIEFPTSQLGSYARRSPFGVPTVYLGDIGGDFAAYVKSPRFEWTVIHEFGHVLGLAHEHQNPRVQPGPPWKSVEDIKKIAAKSLGVPVSDEFVKEEIRKQWPATFAGDDVRFSDWRPAQRDASGAPVFDSIMANPLWKCLLDTGPCANTPDGTCAQECIAYLERPTPADLDQLARMYPPDPRGKK